MTGGGLFDPLGTGRAGPVRPGFDLSAPVAVVAVVVLGLGALIAFAWFRDDGDRGTARAISTIDHVVAPPKPPAPPVLPPPPPAAAPPASPAPPPAAAQPPVRDDQDVEIQNGVRIIRPRRDRPAFTGETLRVPVAPR